MKMAKDVLLTVHQLSTKKGKTEIRRTKLYH